MDVGTRDLERSIAFYEALFGWDSVDAGDGDDEHVTFTLDGVQVAGCIASPKGARPRWTTSFATDDVDATSSRIVAALGELVSRPTDAPGGARSAIARDPAGALFTVRQSGGRPGTGIVDEPGAPTWHELATPNAEGAVAFYTRVLGWDEEKPGGLSAYRVLRAGGRAVGIWQTDEPAGWGVYFAVADADRTAGHSRRLGGTVVSRARDTPQGRVVALRDPAGATFTVLQVAEDSAA